MHRILSTCLEMAAAAVFLFPIFLYLHRTKFRSVHTTAAAFTFSLYLSAVYAMAGLPTVGYVRFHPSFNLVPFRYLFTDRSSLLNVFLFIPLGFFLPVLRSKFRTFFPTLLFGFGMSVFIELCQIFTLRATDVNDLMTNTAGTIIGYFCGRLLLKLFPRLTPAEETNELKTICAAVLFVMFFLQPFLSAFAWRILYYS